MNTQFKKIEYMLVKCGSCNADIERVKTLANRIFTCFDCKKEKQKKYDATKVRITARKDHRIYRRVEVKAEPLTAHEQKSVDRWLKKKHRTGVNRNMFRNSYNKV